jgi:hypothetical protein
MTARAMTDAPWSGWHRPAAGRPWRRVCEAESWDACWAVLTASCEGGDLTVLSAEVDPNARPTARAGRG